MKTHTILVLALLCYSITALAGPPIWPRQPKLSAAYESLTIALKQVELSRTGEPKRHLARASAELSAAKIHLETAKKNKGSARLVAIYEIEAAEKEIAAASADPKHLDAATAQITEAMEKVSRAAKTGR
ncbi:MAG: hypothetical protein SFU53_03755 [Terrimicrobiaceae bacterium]|nr:hypothetical protein [Terrimicrobiaceae bacterium]